VAAARSVLDLHQYSRGMAYAAIKSAIKEVLIHTDFLIYPYPNDWRFRLFD
jgi:hypothetical protein